MIKLEVGQKVKLRDGRIGKVIELHRGCSDVKIYNVIFSNENRLDSKWYGQNGKPYTSYRTNCFDIVEILNKEEEEPMETKEIKVRYFHDDNRLMFIQNVKESTITIVDIWEYEIQSVIDYGTPIKAKEQMYTYAKLFEVAEVKSH